VTSGVCRQEREAPNSPSSRRSADEKHEDAKQTWRERHMQEFGHQIVVGPDAVIFREEDAGDSAFVIERGTVEVSINRNGRKVVLGRRRAGEVFGEMSIIDDRPRTATVTTVEPCRLVKITRDQIRNRIKQTDPILRMYLGVILDRFRETLRGLQEIELGELTGRPAESDSAPTLERPSNDYDYAIKEIKLEEELSEALRHNDFELHFQPIVDLRRKRLVGFESLIRWRHRQRGLVCPKDFLATAEASGLIVPIGSWVFKRSCEFLRRLGARAPAADGAEHLFVSVNISAQDFSQTGFVEDVMRVVKQTGVSPRDIKLEVTETTLISQPDLVAEALQRLRDAGFSIAIDDFGTGFSSLSYLHRYPFDTLKIDRSFVQNLHNNPKNNGIVASIAALANHLELAVVAEGIETLEQERTLRELNCAFAQGYLYSRPVPEAEIDHLLEFWRGGRRPLTLIA
jgi:EAL domain-containing protein (putative c-di-GMP-specific phosphodiesterase class I)